MKSRTTTHTGLSAYCPDASCRRVRDCRRAGPKGACLGMTGLMERFVAVGYRSVDRSLHAMIRQWDWEDEIVRRGGGTGEISGKRGK